MPSDTSRTGTNAVVYFIVTIAFVALGVWNVVAKDPWFALCMGGLAVVWASLGVRELRRGRRQD